MAVRIVFLKNGNLLGKILNTYYLATPKTVQTAGCSGPLAGPPRITNPFLDENGTELNAPTDQAVRLWEQVVSIYG